MVITFYGEENMELRCYADKTEKILLRFWPCINEGENMEWEKWHMAEPLVVYATDYCMLLLYLRNIFPAIDPTNGKKQDAFDLCFHNFIGIEDWERVVRHIKNDAPSNESEKEKQFFSQFVGWIESQLFWADMIVVEGNL